MSLAAQPTVLLQKANKGIKDPIYERKSNKPWKTLRRKVRSTKYYSHNTFLQENFGCLRCPLAEFCPEKIKMDRDQRSTPTKYKDSEKKFRICKPRADMFGSYMQAGHGELLPLMKDHLVRLMIEREMEEARWRSRGYAPTKEWLILNTQVASLMEKIHRCEKGITVNTAPNLLDQMRETIMIENDKGRIIIQKKNEPDNKGNIGRTEKDIQQKV